MSWNKIKYYLPKKPNIRIKSEPFPAEKRVWKVGKTPNACPACYLSSGEPIGCRGRAWNQVHPHQNSGRILRELEAFPGTQARCSGCASYTPKKPKAIPPLSWQVGQWKKFALPWASTLKQVQDATRNIETSLKSLASVKHFLRFLTQLAIS